MRTIARAALLFSAASPAIPALAQFSAPSTSSDTGFPAASGSINEGFDIGIDRGSPVIDEAAASRPNSQPLGQAHLQLN